MIFLVSNFVGDLKPRPHFHDHVGGEVVGRVNLKSEVSCHCTPQSSMVTEYMRPLLKPMNLVEMTRDNG